MHRVEIKPCSGNPNQYGDCELCNKKITTQTYTVNVLEKYFQPILNREIEVQKFYSFTCLECSEKIKEKYEMEK